MKRVLWICNLILPAIAQRLALSYSNREGWLSGIYGRVQNALASGEEVSFELGICFPLSFEEMKIVNGRMDSKDYEKGMISEVSLGDTDCYAFQENLSTPEIYEEVMERNFEVIFDKYKPDIIHIFGTEFPHARAAVKAFGNPAGTLIGIQGLCGEIAPVYMAGLPDTVQKKVTLRDWLRKDSLRQQQEKFLLRGKNEALAIRGAGNITGRTCFDREGTAKINAQRNYFLMNETMRQEFYTGRWEMKNCEKHSIFMGQGDYPLKGMHFVLEAIHILSQKYTDIKLYVAGNSIIEHKSLKDKLKISAYGNYLLTLIEKYQLADKVCMTGKLDARQMKQQFLQSSLFVCASVLENSPNTVGEAMLLGVPVVAFATGGIPDMITDGQEGLLVETGNVTALAQAIERIWDEAQDTEHQTLAQRISGNAFLRAHRVHDGETNYHRLIEIYDGIYEELL